MATEEKLQYTLTLATQATGSGAKETAADLDKVAAAKNRVDNAAKANSLDDFLQRTETSSRAAYGEVHTLGSKLDELQVKAAKTATDLTPAADNLDKLTLAAKKAQEGASKVSSVATQAGYQITDFAVQVQSGQSAMVAFSQQAPQLIGSFNQLGGAAKMSFGTAVGAMLPLSLITTELAVGIPLVIKAYEKMDGILKKLKNSGEELNKQLRFAAEERLKMWQAEDLKFLNDNYREGAELLERQEAAINRMAGVQSARAGAAEAQAGAAVTIAQNTGGDVGAAQLNALAVGVTNQFDALQSKMMEMAATLNTAQQEAEGAKANMIKVGQTTNEFDDKYKEAAAAYEQKQQVVDDLTLDLEAERQKFEAAKQTISANTSASLSTMQADISSDVTEMGNDAIAAMKEVAEKTGGKLKADSQGAFDRLSAMLGDTVPDSKQMAQITQEVTIFKGSQDAFHSGLQGTFTSLVSGLRERQQQQQQFNNDVMALLGQIQVQQAAGISELQRMAREQARIASQSRIGSFY